MIGSLKNGSTRWASKAAAGLAVAGVCGAVVAAQPWGWHDRDRRVVVVRPPPAVVIEARPRVIYTAPPPVIITQPAPVVVSSTRADVTPSDLRMTAYQSQDTVIVLISGTNTGVGYSTSLTAMNAADSMPTLLMRNAPPNGEVVVGGANAAFSINAAVHTTHALTTLNVQLGDRTYQVPVTAVQSLS